MSNSTTKHSPMICCYRGDVKRHATGISAAPISERRGFVSRPGWEHFQSVLAGLRDLCPVSMPVIVRTTILPSTTLGSCARRGTRFVIRLNSFLTEGLAIDTLLHEWAHALSWHLLLDKLSKQTGLTHEDFEQVAHDELWGCAYSRVWRAYTGHILPSLNNA